jgi:hypothetical protein
MSALDLAALLDSLAEYGRWRSEQVAAQQASQPVEVRDDHAD